MLTILHIEMRPSMNNELTNSETVHVKSRCRKMNLCGVEIKEFCNKLSEDEYDFLICLMRAM